MSFDAADFISGFYSDKARIKPRKSPLLNPFDIVFERGTLSRFPKAYEIAFCAVLTAIAIAGRAVFFWMPFFKPVAAVVILAGIALGGAPGFMVGALSMLISNFMFGQGPWTLFQMLGMGAVGGISGLLTHLGVMPNRRITLSAAGFFLTIIIYGGIANMSSLIFAAYDVSWEMIFALYLSGLPVDIIHGAATSFFLYILSGSVLYETSRIRKRF